MSSKTKKVEVDDDIDDEVDQVVDTKPVKSKKARTPAQQEAFSKALSVLKEKREMKAREEKERYEKATVIEKEQLAKEKYEKAKSHKKKLPPAPSYVTTGDLEKFKMDILSAIPKHEPKPVEVKTQPVRVEPVRKPEPVVKKEPVVQKSLTGHELLDKLFFS